MYMNHFCFVLVLVSVSASYYNEELPLYLSDDILISQLPRISKRSTSDPTKPVEEIQVNNGKKENGEEEIENGEESGLVFITSFGRRSRRSLSPSDHPQVEGKSQAAEDQNKNSNNINNKSLKETSQNSDSQKASESGLVFLPSFGRRNKRSAVEEDLVDAESNIVFLPSFRRNGFRRFRRDLDRHYSKRSVDTQTKNEKNIPDAPTTERNEELSDSDTVNGQESGLVFLPSFGRSRRSLGEKISSPNHQNKNHDAEKNSGQRKVETQRVKQTQGVKGTPNHTHKTKRHASTEKPNRKSEDRSLDENKEDETGEESGLVFIPSFGRRYRRDTSSSTVKNEETNASPTKKEEQVSKKTFSTQESGLVFLPTFNRRTRREVSSTVKPEKDQIGYF